MATDKQIAANRRNAARSTGPRSLRGKAKSRMNAFRHGLSYIGSEPPFSAFPDTAEGIDPEAVQQAILDGLCRIRLERTRTLLEVTELIGTGHIVKINPCLDRVFTLSRYEARLFAARKRAANRKTKQIGIAKP